VVTAYESTNTRPADQQAGRQKGLSDLASYKISLACAAVENAVSKYHALESKINTYSSYTTQQKALIGNKNRQRETVASEAAVIYDWLLFTNNTIVVGSLHPQIEAWARAPAALDNLNVGSLLNEQYPWRNMRFQGIAGLVNNLRISYCQLQRAQEEMSMLAAESVMACYRCERTLSYIRQRLMHIDEVVRSPVTSAYEATYYAGLRDRLKGRYGLRLYETILVQFYKVINCVKPSTPHSWDFLVAEATDEDLFEDEM
jgi:hypothetical protein